MDSLSTDRVNTNKLDSELSGIGFEYVHNKLLKSFKSNNNLPNDY